MWDKWLAALMKAHQWAPYGAAAADWCSGHHRYFKIRALCSAERQHNELNCLMKGGTRHKDHFYFLNNLRRHLSGLRLEAARRSKQINSVLAAGSAHCFSSPSVGFYLKLIATCKKENFKIAGA